MTHVIDFLERLGQDARLRYASAEELDRTLIDEGIDPAVRAALLGEDQRRLEALLGAAANVCCMVYAPDDEEPEDDEGEGESEEGDDPPGEEPKSRQSVPHRAVAI